MYIEKRKNMKNKDELAKPRKLPENLPKRHPVEEEIIKLYRQLNNIAKKQKYPIIADIISKANEKIIYYVRHENTMILRDECHACDNYEFRPEWDELIRHRCSAWEDFLIEKEVLLRDIKFSPTIDCLLFKEKDTD